VPRARALDDAERHFRAAVEMSSRQESTPWLAHAQYRYAAMLLERNRDGDVRYAHTLMASAVQGRRGARHAIFA
jgi:hypothetical protein